MLWVIFCEFGPEYGSALRRFALVMGKLLDIITKDFREKEFSSTSDTKHSLFKILVENFAQFMRSYFKFLP